MTYQLFIDFIIIYTKFYEIVDIANLINLDILKMEPQDKATDHQKTKHQLFNGDGFRLLLLTMLYSVQGFAFGFIDITMPVILKKHFNYSEVGVITWCCIPFSIKFIFAPFVDTYFLK